MRAIWWKELRELALIGIPMLLIAVFAAFGLVSRHDRSDLVLGMAVVGGVAAGVIQGLYDRLRRDDLFYLHRPISCIRIQVARSLAGLTTCCVPAISFLLLHPILTHRAEAELPAHGGIGPVFAPPGSYWGLGAGGSLVVLGIVVGAWTAVRLAIGTRRRWAAALLVILLSLVFWMQISRQETAAAATLALAGVVVACGGLSVLNLAGRIP